MAAAAAAASVAVKAAVQGLPKDLAGRVVLYDGVCNLCNAGVRWVARRDPDKRIMFCSVQSKAAEPYLKGIGLTRQDVLARFVFIEYKDVSEASTAALRVAGYLRWPWSMAKALLVVPVGLRDPVYDYVAARRYQWFGRTQRCQIPATELLDRFVDRDELVAGSCCDEAMDDDDDT